MSDHPRHGEDWDRQQWEGEGQGPSHEGEEARKSPEWHKQQVEGEGQDDIDHSAEDRESADELGEGASDLSGHGQNPGGGKRWATGQEDD